MEQILKRDTALATAAIYDSMFAAEDGTVPATFQVIKIQASFFCIRKPKVFIKTISQNQNCLIKIISDSKSFVTLTYNQRHEKSR